MALSGRNVAYVSIIDGMAGPGVFSQDLLAYCMGGSDVDVVDFLN